MIDSIAYTARPTAKPRLRIDLFEALYLGPKPSGQGSPAQSWSRQAVVQLDEVGRGPGCEIKVFAQSSLLPGSIQPSVDRENATRSIHLHGMDGERDFTVRLANADSPPQAHVTAFYSACTLLSPYSTCENTCDGRHIGFSKYQACLTWWLLCALAPHV